MKQAIAYAVAIYVAVVFSSCVSAQGYGGGAQDYGGVDPNFRLDTNGVQTVHNLFLGGYGGNGGGYGVPYDNGRGYNGQGANLGGNGLQNGNGGQVQNGEGYGQVYNGGYGKLDGKGPQGGYGVNLGMGGGLDQNGALGFGFNGLIGPNPGGEPLLAHLVHKLIR